MTDHEKIKRQEIINLLKIEVEVLCEGLHGAAYNAVWEDEPKLANIVNWILERELAQDKKENPNAYI